MKTNILFWLISFFASTSLAFEIVCLPCLVAVKALLVNCNPAGLVFPLNICKKIFPPQIGESIILTSLLASRGQLPGIPGLNLPGFPGSRYSPLYLWSVDTYKTRNRLTHGLRNEQPSRASRPGPPAHLQPGKWLA